MDNNKKVSLLDKIKNSINNAFGSSKSYEKSYTQYSKSSNSINISSGSNSFDSPKGSLTSKTFDFKNITALHNGTTFDVVLDNSPENIMDSAKLEAYEGQIEKIHLTERNGTLIVSADNGNYNKVKITLKSRFINEITNSGTADLTGNFIGENLTLNNSGTGDVQLEGRVSYLDINSSGTGDIEFDYLEAQKVKFKNSGTGDITVNATQEISGKNTGTGDVNYCGIRESSIKNSGVGDVRYRGPRR